PQYYPLEIVLKERICPVISTKPNVTKKTIRRNRITNKINHTNVTDAPVTAPITASVTASVKPDPVPKEITITMSPNTNDENLNIFASDKKSYVKIKFDVENGFLKKDQIHPLFVIKYQIFQILESRGVINFLSDEQIKTEYDIYITLYDACKEENEDNEDKEKKASVWIPPNYHYLTDEKKEEYATKYKMNRAEFEDKYINN